MTTWDEFAAAAPELAANGRRLFERTGSGEALLATVRGDALPRIHPIAIGIVEGRLLGFLIVGSAKTADLAADGRYALHAHQDPAEPHEFLVRGRAREVSDHSLRSAAAAAWSFTVDEGYRLFEFSIDHAVFGERGDPNAWPPVYSSWRSEGASSARSAADKPPVSRVRGSGYRPGHAGGFAVLRDRDHVQLRRSPSTAFPRTVWRPPRNARSRRRRAGRGVAASSACAGPSLGAPPSRGAAHGLGIGAAQ